MRVFVVVGLIWIVIVLGLASAAWLLFEVQPLQRGECHAEPYMCGQVPVA